MLPLLFISFLCPGRVHLTVIGDRFVFSSSSLEQKLSLPFAAGGKIIVLRVLVVRPPCGACWPPYVHSSARSNILYHFQSSFGLFSPDTGAGQVLGVPKPEGFFVFLSLWGEVVAGPEPRFGELLLLPLAATTDWMSEPQKTAGNCQMGLF